MVFDDFFKTATKQKAVNATKKAKENNKGPKVSKESPRRSTNGARTNKKRTISSSPDLSKRDHTKRRRTPPSVEALDLSKQLKDCSRLKHLDRALELYKSNKKIVDEHHACILIDCCARCGRVDTAVEISEPFMEHANVETATALLKAYGCGGYMKESFNLFERTVQQANVRTLNTILRGCLWTAVDVDSFGGVETSEKVWKLYVSHHSINAISVGTSAFEYTILLLCQALRVGEAQERIQLFMDTYKLEYKGAGGFQVQNGSTEAEQTMFETMAVAHAALARAFALLSRPDDLWKTAQRALSAIKLSRQFLLNEKTSSVPKLTGKAKKKAKNDMSGGKQAWRRADQTAEAEAARANSNQLFRKHRLDEIESDVKQLIQLRSKLPAIMTTTKLLRKRLWYASGGGLTCKSSKEEKVTDLVASSDMAAWKSFGLSHIERKPGKKNKKVHTPLQTHASAVTNDDRLDFSRLFGNDQSVELEIGAGFGSWIVHQAKQNRNRNFIAIEMKADRVAQIFTRCALEQLSNVSIFGAECLSFLQNHVPKDSLSNVYANHPEPPTQTFGMYDREGLEQIARGDTTAEPSHMLTSQALISIGHCLVPKVGRFTIVTDNRNYVKLLTATVACAVQRGKQIRSVSAKLLRNKSLKLIESPTFGSEGTTVHVYEGMAEPKNKGTSYFDKLWNAGAGRHAERTSRFYIVLERS